MTSRSDIALAAFIAIAAAPAFPASVDEARITALMRRHVDIAHHSPGIAVAVMDAAGTRVFVHGLARPASAAPVQRDTRFEIGSITKPLVATLAAALERDGVLSLADRLDLWLPELAGKPAGALTLLQLATHTSGLPRLPLDARFAVSALSNPRDPYARYGDDELFAFLKRWTPGAPAPTAFGYSNLGYALLGQALARAAKQPLGDALAERVLRPAGAVAMAWGPGSTALAQGYNSNGDAVPPWSLGPFEGAGALVASIDDMAALLTALVQRRQPFDLDLFAQRVSRGEERGIGLGWLRTERHGDRIIWHNGGTGGFRSFIGFSEIREVGVAVLANSTVDVDDLGLHLLNAGFDPPAPPPAGMPAWVTPIVSLLGPLLLLAWWPASRTASGRFLRNLTVPASRLDATASIVGVVAFMAFFWVAGDWSLVGRSGRVAIALATLAAAAAALVFLLKRLSASSAAGTSRAQRIANGTSTAIAVALAAWAWTWG